jgi:hypothetical protein
VTDEEVHCADTVKFNKAQKEIKASEKREMRFFKKVF